MTEREVMVLLCRLFGDMQKGFSPDMRRILMAMEKAMKQIIEETGEGE